MEKLICFFSKFGCADKSGWPRSQFHDWYWKHVRVVWRTIFPDWDVMHPSSDLHQLHNYYLDVAGFVFDGYWIIPAVVLLVWVFAWKYLFAHDEEMTKKLAAWLILKWSVIAALACSFALIAFAIVCLGFVIPLVAEGIGRPAVERRLRW